MDTKNPFELMTVKEAADVLCISPHTLYRMIWRREITYIKLGSRVIFRFSDLKAYVEAHTKPALPPAVKYQTDEFNTPKLKEQQKKAQREARERTEKMLREWRENGGEDTAKDELLRRSVGSLACTQKCNRRPEKQGQTSPRGVL